MRVVYWQLRKLSYPNIS